MSKKKQQFLTVLGAVAGTAVTAIAIRKAVGYWQTRQQRPLLGSRNPSEMLRSRSRYYDTPSPRGEVDASEAYRAITQPRYQPADQPDRQAIPATGNMPPTVVGDYTPVAPSKVNMDDLAGPLIEYAIAFNSVMNLLRSKQRDNDTIDATQAFTAGDRSSMRAVLDQLSEHLPDFDETSVGKNSLHARTFRLAQKLRQSLENLEYTESDLFRINGEVTQELCRLTQELQQSGEVTITGLDQIRQLYTCRG